MGRALVLAVPLAVLGLGLRSALAWTGEEELGQQLRGLYHLTAAALRPQPRADPHVPMGHVGLNPLGVNAFLHLEAESDKVERSLAMISAAGFGFIRQELPWEDIEIHGKGDFEDRRHPPHRSAWEKYDRIVELAREHGLELIVRLDKPPPWAGPSAFAPPERLDDYADFVGAVARRYRGKVGYYQLWNEPNLGIEWGGRPDARAYVDLLCAGYRAVKAADPQAVVLSAALAPTTERGPENVDDLLFWREIYRWGGGSCFEVASAQAYGLWTGPGDRRLEPGRVNFSRPLLLRALMVEMGDGGKPVWLSEVGWTTAPEGQPAPYGRVTPRQQARYTVAALERVLNEWPWVGVINLWFFRRPDESERGQPFYQFRLVESSFAPRPVWEAVASWAPRARAVYPGWHQEDHWSLEYRGPWEQASSPHVVLGSYRVGRPGALLQGRFKGTEARLLLAPGTAHVRITVGSRTTERTVERELGLARGLPDDIHDFRVEVLQGSLAVDGLVVSRSPWPAGILTAAAAGLVCLLALALGWRWWRG